MQKPVKAKLSIKPLLPRTLFGRSLLILVIPVLLIQIITSVIFFDRHWSKMTGRLAFAVAGEVSMLAQYVDSEEDPLRLEAFFDRYAHNLDLLVSIRPGETVQPFESVFGFHIWDFMVRSKLAEELRNQTGRIFKIRSDFREKWVAVDIQTTKGVLSITFPQRRLFSSSGYIFLLWMIGTSTVLLLIAIIFMRNQIRPIRKLAVAAERFGKGREVGSFKPEGAREVRQAGAAFLDMNKRIRRQVEQRTAMLAGVSHDLRTPLTRMKLQLAMFPDSEEVSGLRTDLSDMEKMIAGYLDFVRGGEDEPSETVYLNPVIKKICDSFSSEDTVLNTNIENNLYFTLKPVAFERLLNNLISNACNYADKVWLKIQTKEHHLSIVVEDNGPGIPEDKYEEVFRPFYRLDPSRNSATGGVGLGLPIVMDIVHAHGGEVFLDKSEYGGLKATVILPD